MKPKLLILKNEISSYNVPIYNLLAEKYDLTVAYYLKDKSSIECKFNKINLQYNRIHSLIFIKGLNKIIRQYDIVSVVADPHVPAYFLRPFYPRKYKVVTWGIGFRCSYTHPYQPEREHTFVDKLIEVVLKKADANIFYMDKAKDFWRGCGLDFSKVFVAPNTTEVIPVENNFEQKENILFVGTLYRGKGLDLLLNSFKEALDKSGKSTKLVIVGDGEMKDEVLSFVKENQLQDRVDLTGSIYDEKILSEQFKKALICVSPTQGGLTCPKSMGYGVPFICRKDAITGGEIYHMTSGIDGIMYEKDSDLTEILLDAMTNPNKYIEMGRKAKEYYNNTATINHMAQGAIEAYNFVLNN